MSHKIVFKTITEHFTLEECELLSLRDVVDRKGFQTMRLVTMKPTTKGEEPVTLVAIQFVEMVDIETPHDAEASES